MNNFREISCQRNRRYGDAGRLSLTVSFLYFKRLGGLGNIEMTSVWRAKSGQQHSL